MNKLQPYSAEDLYNIVVHGEDQISHWSKEDFQAEINNPQSKLYTLVQDGELIGFVCYLDSVEDEVEILFLATKFKGQGIGTQLLKAFLQKHQKHAVFLEFSEKNKIAKALYLKFGFVEINCRKKYYSDGSDALCMKWCANF